MRLFKYGILISSVDTEWKIAIVDKNALQQTINVPHSSFDFSPSLGDSVKVGFDERDRSAELTVTKCHQTEWIRDVTVCDSTVIVYAIAHFSRNSLRRSFRSQNSSDERDFYIMEDVATDFGKIAIPKFVVDEELDSRSERQKETEPLVYRVGVCYEPMRFEDGRSVEWRYFHTFEMVPIFENFARDETLPFISESMVYGVLEALVISHNADESLFWAPRMGFSVLSSASSSQKLLLGSVHLILVQRCLEDRSFGFPCRYNVFPSILDHTWRSLNVITDDGNVYIEARGTCVRLQEKTADRHHRAMQVPHLGKLTRGVENIWHRLHVGSEYTLRVEFQKGQDTIEPVVVDVHMENDIDVTCRIVQICPNTRTYYAVLDTDSPHFERVKDKIDFVAISFRTFFCTLGIQLKPEHLLMHRFRVRVPEPIQFHSTVQAVRVDMMEECRKSVDMKVMCGKTWMRTMARIETRDELGLGAVMYCLKLGQNIDDYSGLSSSFGLGETVAIIAESIVIPGGEPTFLVRHVAHQFTHLPRLTPQLIAGHPSVDSVYAPILFGPVERLNDVNSDVSIAGEEHDPRFDVDTIMNESEVERAGNHRDLAEDLAGLSVCGSEMGEVVEESWMDSTLSSSSVIIAPRAKLPSLRPAGSLFASRGAPRMPYRPLKYGIRRLKNKFDDRTVLRDIVYLHEKSPKMFVEYASEAVNSWRRRPAGKVVTAKRRTTTVYGVELKDYTIEHATKNCPFKYLVRLFVQDNEVPLVDRSVVIPVGGNYPTLPDHFRLGQRFSAIHYVCPPDRMVRIGGYADYVGLPSLKAPLPEKSQEPISELQQDGQGNEWLRMETSALRPSEPLVRSNEFELWEGFDVGGYVIVVKEVDLMARLEPQDPEKYVHYKYKLVVEPLAGGPIDVSILSDKARPLDEPIVFWRYVHDYPPTVIERVKVYKPPPPPIVPPRDEKAPRHEDYRVYETMAINQKLTQQRIDRLRAAGDPRIKQLDGPDLKPELEVRKVGVVERREKMLATFDRLLRELPRLHRNGYFIYVTAMELEEKIDNYEKLDDENHLHNFRQRERALGRGCDFLCEILVQGEVYKELMVDANTRDILRHLADCIGLNRTYIKQEESVKKMLIFMYKNKLHDHL